MIYQPRALGPRSARYLSNWQLDVLAKQRALQSKYATAQFKAKNTSKNATFREIRNGLAEASPGDGYCLYCEIGRLERIDHVLPKSFYPEFVFSYDNLVYCCARCNEVKLSKAGLLTATGVSEVIGISNSISGSPMVSDFAFVNPRTADWYSDLVVDIGASYFIVPKTSLSSLQAMRYAFTIDSLGLNKRSDLVRRRKGACTTYLSLCREYILSSCATRRLEIVHEIKSASCQLVWSSMLEVSQRDPSFGDVRSFCIQAGC